MPKPEPPKKDAVKKLQEFAAEEAARNKKKKTEIKTEPEKGFLSRMYDKYMKGSK